MKKIIADVLYVFLIISLIGFMLFTINFLKSNGKDCLRDPITYFEEKNEGAECSCTKDGIEWPNTVKKEVVGHQNVEINYSKFNLTIKD